MGSFPSIELIFRTFSLALTAGNQGELRVMTKTNTFVLIKSIGDWEKLLFIAPFYCESLTVSWDLRKVLELILSSVGCNNISSVVCGFWYHIGIDTQRAWSSQWPPKGVGFNCLHPSERSTWMRNAACVLERLQSSSSLDSQKCQLTQRFSLLLASWAIGVAR